MTNRLVFASAQFLSSEGWLDYLRLMLVLGGVLIVAFFTLRFWLPKLASVNRNTSGPIQVITRFSLEPNKSLYVLAVGRSKILVASSEAGVQLIKPLTGDEFEEALNNKKEPQNENTFERFLQSMKLRKNV